MFIGIVLVLYGIILLVISLFTDIFYEWFTTKWVRHYWGKTAYKIFSVFGGVIVIVAGIIIIIGSA